MWVFCKINGKHEIVDFGNDTIQIEDDMISIENVLRDISGQSSGIIYLRFIGLIKKEDSTIIRARTSRVVPFIFRRKPLFNSMTAFSLGYDEEESPLICESNGSSTKDCCYEPICKELQESTLQKPEQLGD